MANLNILYGNGKNADFCEIAHAYAVERNQQIVTINADRNQTIVSETTGSILTREPNFKIVSDTNLYDAVIDLDYAHTGAVLVANAHLLNEFQMEELYFVTKCLEVPVSCYTDRMTGNKATPGTMRGMELADHIRAVDSSPEILRHGQLQFFYGAMNCSKSSKLIRRANVLQAQGIKVCSIRFEQDRDVSKITSRSGLSLTPTYCLGKEANFNSLGEEIVERKFRHILVDEAQFFTNEQIDQLWNITRWYDIPVSCYGLKVNFKGQHFDGSGRLLELYDFAEKLEAACLCGNHCREAASFNPRYNLNTKEWDHDGAEVQIEGLTPYDYVPSCPACMIEHYWEVDPKKPKEVQKMLSNRNKLIV